MKQEVEDTGVGSYKELKINIGNKEKWRITLINIYQSLDDRNKNT